MQPPSGRSVAVSGVVVAGHGVASGTGPGWDGPGSLALQAPLFAARGLDLTGMRLATLNVSLATGQPEFVAADHTFRQVRWRDDLPAEDFSFFSCAVVDPAGRRHAAWVYRPHPDTKPAHHQPGEVLEVIAPDLPGVGRGSQVTLLLDPTRIRVR